MPVRSHPPAWYPDPKDPARLRRWDGRAWTSDVRPLPEWLRTLRLSAGPGAKSLRTSRRLWAMSGGLLALGALLMVILAAEGREDDSRLQDRAFVREANRRCARANEEVVQPNREPRKGGSEADRVEALAAGWEVMVADLRRLQPAGADRAKVDRWLRAWGRWTEEGRDYARALRAGDAAGVDEASERSRGPKQEVSRFAYVNGMNACILR